MSRRQPLRKLSAAHKRACALIVTGADVEEIAQDTGLREQTVYELRTDPLIKERVEQLRQDIRDQAAGILRESSYDAIRYMMRAVAPSRPVDSVGVKAAIDLLNRVDMGVSTTPGAGGSHLTIGGDVTDAQVVVMLGELPPWMLDAARKNQEES